MKKQILLVASILLLGFSIVSAQTPKTISGGIVNGKAQNLPTPEYPAAAKAVKAGGTVNVQVTIDENGSVTEASAVSGHPLLRQAAEDAARQAKFAPTQLSGYPVKVTGVIVYNFTPSQSFIISDAPVQGPARIMSDGAATEQSPSTFSGKSISGGVVNGKARNLVVPAYPAAAKAVGASGAVNVQVTIDENGDIASASAVSGHPLLRAAAEQAAAASKFAPTMLQGQPVRVTGIIIYNFVGDKPASNNEEKLKIMGLGTYLSLYSSLDQSEIIKKEELSEITSLADELKPLTSINRETSKENRAKTVNEVTASIRNKLSGADAWQFEFGKIFGEMMIEVKKSGGTMDETKVKTNLLEMKDLLYTAPTNFPADVLGKFKELTKFADVQNINSDANKYRFMQLIGETLNIISPD